MSVSQDQLLETIASMTVLELSEFIKKVEEKFGVSAAAPVAVAGFAAGAPARRSCDFGLRHRRSGQPVGPPLECAQRLGEWSAKRHDGRSLNLRGQPRYAKQSSLTRSLKSWAVVTSPLPRNEFPG